MDSRFCAEHRKQPFILIFVLVFTVGAGTLQYLGFFQGLNDVQPDLKLFVRQTRTVYDSRANATQMLLDVEVANFGAPTVTTCWRVEYHSPVHEELMGIFRGANDEPVLVPVDRTDTSPGALAIALDLPNSINFATETKPIFPRAPVRGRMVVVIPGNRASEFQTGAGLIKMSICDDTRRQHFYHEFHALGEDEPLLIQPTDKVVRFPK